jgi:hypothetical protein
MTANPSPAWPAADAWPAPPPWPAPPRRPTRAGRVAALFFGALFLLPGLAGLGGGGILLWADLVDRTDGFVASPQEDFSSEGYALVSDRIDLDAGPDWLPVSSTVGTARLEVTGTGADAVFVGIAPAADARAYLDGVQRTVVDGLGFDAPATDSDQVPGDEPSGPPAEQDFWIAQATGHGTQEVTWDPADGDWMFVVMNADGSQRVEIEARIGAEIPALVWIGWGALGVGSVLTFVGVRLLSRASRPTWDPSVVYRQPQGTWSPRRPSSAPSARLESGDRRVEEHSA